MCVSVFQTERSDRASKCAFALKTAKARERRKTLVLLTLPSSATRARLAALLFSIPISDRLRSD